MDVLHISINWIIVTKVVQNKINIGFTTRNCWSTDRNYSCSIVLKVEDQNGFTFDVLLSMNLLGVTELKKGINLGITKVAFQD